MSSSVENPFVALLSNACEGDSDGPVSGCLPDWFRQQGAGDVFVYNGPVGTWDFEKESVRWAASYKNEQGSLS